MFNQNAVIAEEIFCFRFRQEEISSIDFSQKVINLTVNKDKSLEKNCSQNLSTPLGLYISSNKDWKLYIRKISNTKNNDIRYYFRPLGADSSINLDASNDYIILNENPILVAHGKSTINTVMNCLDKKLISIDYLVKSSENELMPEGTFSEEIEYKLETED